MVRVNDIQVSRNFKLYEFECKDGSGLVKVDPELLDKLQKLRDLVKRPIMINSGYRTPEHNKKVGGSPNSQHLLGKAADIVISGLPPSMVAEFAEQVGFNGVGVYNTFTHVDVRNKKVSW